MPRAKQTPIAVTRKALAHVRPARKTKISRPADTVTSTSPSTQPPSEATQHAQDLPPGGELSTRNLPQGVKLTAQNLRQVVELPAAPLTLHTLSTRPKEPKQSEEEPKSDYESHEDSSDDEVGTGAESDEDGPAYSTLNPKPLLARACNFGRKNEAMGKMVKRLETVSYTHLTLPTKRIV